MAPEIVTEGSGWHEQEADRAELQLGYVGTGRDRSAAVGALGKRVAEAQPVFDVRGVTVLHRRLAVHDQWRGNRVVGCRATEDVTLRLDDVGPQAPLLVDHHVDGVQGLRMPGSAELAETLGPYIADRLCDAASSVEPALEVSPELTILDHG